MKGKIKDYAGEIKSRKSKEENERLREKLKVQIVLWVKIMHEGRKKMRKGENKGFRGEMKGSKAKVENKKFKEK